MLRDTQTIMALSKMPAKLFHNGVPSTVINYFSRVLYSVKGEIMKIIMMMETRAKYQYIIWYTIRIVELSHRGCC